MARDRRVQENYSDIQPGMLDEQHRRGKATKILAVVRHALGRDLAGLTTVDVGCSAGFIADELASAGAKAIGIDIDEPGLAKARARFGARVDFQLGSGEALPLAGESADIVVLNHVYEHVVDDVALVAEARRVLKPSGLLYLGLGNRLGVVEPHHRLPFLSWLPRGLADRYVRLAGTSDGYHEAFRTRPGLRRLFADFCVWDYTLPVLADPEAFANTDVAPAWVAQIPGALLGAALPLVPTYIWIAFKQPNRPAGPPLRLAPRLV